MKKEVKAVFLSFALFMSLFIVAAGCASHHNKNKKARDPFQDRTFKPRWGELVN